MPYIVSTRTQAVLGSGFNLLNLNPLVWHDKSDINTLFQDSIMSIPVQYHGDPCGAVLDKSGNGYHAIQATGTKKPTYHTGVQNGLSCLYYDGGDQLDNAGVPAQSYPVQIVAVARTTAPIAGGKLTDDLISYVNRCILQEQANFFAMWNGSYLNGIAEDQVCHLWDGVFTGNASASITFDNGSPYVGNAGSVGALDDISMGPTWLGYIMEYIVFANPVTGSSLAGLKSWLNAKWGIW